MQKIVLNWTQAFPKGAYLAEVRPWYAYKDKERTDEQLGLNYVVVNRSGYEKITIKVENKVPVISNEEIEASPADILVEAEGFEGIVYDKAGKISISGKADKVVLVQ